MSSNEDLSQPFLASKVSPRAADAALLATLKSAYGIALEALAKSQDENIRLKEALHDLSDGMHTIAFTVCDLLHVISRGIADEPVSEKRLDNGGEDSRDIDPSEEGESGASH